MRFGMRMLACVGVTLSAASAYAQSDTASTDTDDITGPLQQGAYVAPMASAVVTTHGNTDHGYGGVLSAGYRRDWYALEGRLSYARVSGKDSGHADEIGGGLYGLLFPFRGVPDLYGIAGGGMLNLKRYPVDNGSLSYTPRFLSAGAGYLWSLHHDRYDFAVRTEVLFRRALHSGLSDVPSKIDDVVFNVGLQLPTEKRPAPVAPPAPSVAVVPVAAPIDSDGDGVSDDLDRCPATPAGVQVDETGCPLPPPCKPPEAGQRVDLSGCAVGDSIVLRGVNFEYDQSKLTVNAQTILDGVADALNSAAGIEVEIDGHTDSRGSDEYNQKLSQARAQAVMQYLVSRGVDAGRMTAKGEGELQPIADNDTEEGRELNRRVELKITAGANPATAPVSPPEDVNTMPESAAPETIESTTGQ